MLQPLLDNPLFMLFAIIGLGLALGNLQIAGLSLGSSAVLFVGLAAGHFGYHVYDQVGTLGLVLFVYGVGVGAGGRFFAALRKQGQALAILALLVTGSGALLTWGLSKLLSIPTDMAVGLYAGALTSTPALAAATEVLRGVPNQVSVAYGIAYPFGVIGVVLFVQLWPRLLGLNLAKAGSRYDADQANTAQIASALVRVQNPALLGLRVEDFDGLQSLECQITRVLREGRLQPLRYDDSFTEGQELLLVGRSTKLDTAIRLLGIRSESSYTLDTERERRQLLLTRKEFTGKSLRELQLLREYRIVISRVTRLGFTFVPTRDTVLERHDGLTAVGSPEDLEAFAQAIGHRSQAFEEADLLSIGLGIALGLVLGMISLSLPGGEGFSLGLVGGPLLAGLLLGHFGRIGPISGHVPRPTRLFLQELGLVLFLAEAGIKGGEHLVATLQQHGLLLFGAGAVITLLPMALAYPVARYVFKLDILATLGGLCGGMTSTPALGAISAKTDSQGPVVAYAAAYPVALILMTLFAKLLLN